MYVECFYTYAIHYIISPVTNPYMFKLSWFIFSQLWNNKNLIRINLVHCFRFWFAEKKNMTRKKRKQTWYTVCSYFNFGAITEVLPTVFRKFLGEAFVSPLNQIIFLSWIKTSFLINSMDDNEEPKCWKCFEWYLARP
jgi:hypothetical protein